MNLNNKNQTIQIEKSFNHPKSKSKEKINNLLIRIMFVSEISLWGAAIVACVVLVAMVALAFTDNKMLWPVSAAMFVGSIILGGSAMLMMPISVFLSIYSVLMACMTVSLMQTMMSFQRNQQKPEAMREDMCHQVRNLAQPLVMVIPMLYAGMLLGGVSVLEGLLVTLLLIAASFVANILSGFVALGMIKKNKV